MSLTDLEAHLTSLPPQRLILRAVDELRPHHGDGGATVVGRVTYVEVVHVVEKQSVRRRFDGVRLDEARRVAQARGHTVLERTGNIT